MEGYGWKWGIVEQEREGGKGDARDFLGLVIFWSPVCATVSSTVLHSARVPTRVLDYSGSDLPYRTNLPIQSIMIRLLAG